MVELVDTTTKQNEIGITTMDVDEQVTVIFSDDLALLVRSSIWPKLEMLKHYRS